MSSVERHRAAADTHEAAAQAHEQSARFWDQFDDPDRAKLQHEMAAYERHGAELERRWAELGVETEVAPPVPELGPVLRDVHQNASHLVALLSRSAELFEQSAALAEEHATHPAIIVAGHEADERRTAERAREAARRARAHAEQFAVLSGRNGLAQARDSCG